MVISADLMVFVYSSTRDIVLHIPMRDISGWIQEGKRLGVWLVGVARDDCYVHYSLSIFSPSLSFSQFLSPSFFPSFPFFRINLFYDGSYCVSLEVNEVEDVRDITCRLLALGPCLSASHEVR